MGVLLSLVRVPQNDLELDSDKGRSFFNSDSRYVSLDLQPLAHGWKGMR